MIQQDCSVSAVPGHRFDSPAQHSGLKDLALPQCSVGCNYGSDLILGPGTPYARGRQEKKRKEKSKQIKA